MTKEERKEYNKKYRENNKEKINEHNTKWRNANLLYISKLRDENRDRYNENAKKYRNCNKELYLAYQLEYQRKYRASNRDKINAYNRRIGRRASSGLTDNYVKTVISQGFKITFSEIPSKMIELKRTQLINKRLIKNLKENETE